MHNPFTSVIPEDIDTMMNASINDKETLLSLKSNAYDIVLNGSEIGGGSIRISKPEEQAKIFELIANKWTNFFLNVNNCSINNFSEVIN